MKTKNPKVLAAADEILMAVGALARAEGMLQHGGDVSLGIHITLLNNITGILRNLTSDMLYRPITTAETMVASGMASTLEVKS